MIHQNVRECNKEQLLDDTTQNTVGHNVNSAGVQSQFSLTEHCVKNNVVAPSLESVLDRLTPVRVTLTGRTFAESERMQTDGVSIMESQIPSPRAHSIQAPIIYK